MLPLSNKNLGDKYVNRNEMRQMRFNQTVLQWPRSLRENGVVLVVVPSLSL